MFKTHNPVIVRAEYYKTIHNSINNISCVLNSSQHTQHSGRGLQEDNTNYDGFRRLILNPAYAGAMGNALKSISHMPIQCVRRNS